MLQVIYTTDKSILTPLEQELFGGGITGVKAVLYDGEVPVGLCVLTLSDVVEITAFEVKEAHRIFAVIDFFFRVVLFKLSNMDYTIFVRAVDDRLTKFGFAACEGGMSVNSKDVKFPSSCKH